MRGSPSCEITVRQTGGWRPAIAAIALATLAAIAAWLAGSPLGTTAVARLGAAAAALAVLAAAVSLLRRPAVTLRWDGLEWSAEFADRPGAVATLRRTAHTARTRSNTHTATTREID